VSLAAWRNAAIAVAVEGLIALAGVVAGHAVARSRQGFAFNWDVGLAVWVAAACIAVMAIAVLIDATLVRAFLMPALLQLCGEMAWWSPRPLARQARARP